MLFGLETVDGILAGCPPGLQGHSGQGHRSHQQQSDWEGPPGYGGVLGEILQREIAADERNRCCSSKTDEDEFAVVAAEHHDDFTGAGTGHLADADFLAAVFGIEHRQAEYPDEGGDQADDAQIVDQLEEAEFVGIGFFQRVVEEHQVVSIIAELLMYHLVGQSSHLVGWGVGCDAHIQRVAGAVLGPDDEERVVVADACRAS